MSQKSEDSDDIEVKSDSLRDKTKSKDREKPKPFSADHYVPQKFRGKTPNANTETNQYMKYGYIKMDLSAIQNCTSYMQIFVLCSTLIMILVMLLNGCVEDEEQTTQVVTQPLTTESLVNTTDSMKVTSAENSGPVEEESESRSRYQMKCLTGYFFVAVLIICASVQTFSLLFYLFHLIETFDYIPWLVIEIMVLSVWSLIYFALSIILVVFGKWLAFISFLGFVDTLILLVLVCIKCRRYHRGKRAQDTGLIDPDANIKRQLSPNYKFTKSDPKLDKKKTDKLTKTNSFTSL